MLLLRAILAFLALPALVGFAIPIWLGTSTGRPMRYFVPVRFLRAGACCGGSRTLIIYLMSFAIGFHLRVLVYEEPWAARRFGPQWDAYRACVPRWVI